MLVRSQRLGGELFGLGSNSLVRNRNDANHIDKREPRTEGILEGK